MTVFDALALMAAGAFAGSLSFAAWLARLAGADVFDVGSRSMGAMNVFRNISKPLGVAVLLLDASKGALAILLAAGMAVTAGLPETQALWWAAAGVPLGHGWSPFVRMRGGRGLAPAWGALTAIAWPLGVAAMTALVAWILILRQPTWGLWVFLLTFPVLTAGVMLQLGASGPALWTALAASTLMACTVAWKSRGGLGRY